MTVSDVAGDNLDLVQSRNILQPAPEIERIILGQRCYVRSGAQQMFDQVGADESISPRHKNAFALKFHLAELSPRFHFRSPTGPSSGSLDHLCAPIAPALLLQCTRSVPLCLFKNERTGTVRLRRLLIWVIHKADSLPRVLLAVGSCHLQWATSHLSLLTSDPTPRPSVLANVSRSPSRNVTRGSQPNSRRAREISART